VIGDLIGFFKQYHAIAAATFVFTRPAWRRWIRDRLWAVPRLGEVLRIYHLARFYRTLGMLLRSGVPLLSALDMAEGLLDPAFRPALRQARRAVSEGQPASDAMHRNGLTTPMALSMLCVGERTGELGSMMDRVAGLYGDEVSRWVDVATRLFEPLLMVLIGLLIGVIVVLLYLPVFELANSLK
jgi:general secretion pathway protein F